MSSAIGSLLPFATVPDAGLIIAASSASSSVTGASGSASPTDGDSRIAGGSASAATTSAGSTPGAISAAALTAASRTCSSSGVAISTGFFFGTGGLYGSSSPRSALLRSRIAPPMRSSFSIVCWRFRDCFLMSRMPLLICLAASGSLSGPRNSRATIKITMISLPPMPNMGAA